ncbi:hypothetical protein dsat_1529 [Alkalidesulfovibrio alkalitolerans DSM 16529]|uniref:Uncharacterized protein n=1 Tax=Alkalidesulfovibrio alkalitolerans DSM 16529 TaxID=1121439 RepID=S7U8X4_9BACT|nr:hypothetical protein [Alkalidesulfovibrio alkalitolerans]EPR30389.1 hypothetical protein dsat_1529 [Alkalidesulfovibrio alkalitolerans DSM 16529]
MATIIPASELHRKAIDWISCGLRDGKPLRKLIDEAAMRFNLGPLDAQFLERFYKNDLRKQKDVAG